MTDIKIYLWDEGQFNGSQKDWAKLLERSNSDRLFMSWEWLSTWWNVFSDSKSMQLRIYVALSGSGELIGIAPFYLSMVRTKKFLKTKRLQFIGNCWRGKLTMRTELQDFIVDNNYAVEVIEAFYRHINSLQGWDEVVFSDMPKNSETYRLLVNKKPLKNAYYRHAEEFNSYYLKLSDNFESFCSSLGKNTRLKLFNRRKLLETLGEVEFLDITDGDVNTSFSLLNSLHKQRWGKPVFEGERLEFNRTVAELMKLKNGLLFSIILLDKKPVSIQFNYVINNREYNIQAGFDERFHKKISLGYLHFGYEIECAFNKNLKVYDFLAGEGKNTQYKERLTSSTKNIVCMQVVRNTFLKTLYRLYDFYSKFR